MRPKPTSPTSLPKSLTILLLRGVDLVAEGKFRVSIVVSMTPL